MSVFGSIMGAIFGHGSAQASASPTAASGTILRKQHRRAPLRRKLSM